MGALRREQVGGVPKAVKACSSLSWQSLRQLGSGPHAILGRLMHPKRTGALQSQPLYEVLDYNASVQLLDTQGRDAHYVRRERVRFLRDHVTGWYDYGWGSGIPFADYEFSPGRIVDRRLIGG